VTAETERGQGVGEEEECEGGQGWSQEANGAGDIR